MRLSLKEIMSLVDLTAEFEWRRKLWFQIGKATVENTLRNNRNDCLLPFFRSCTQEGFEKDILEVLDQGNFVIIITAGMVLYLSTEREFSCQDHLKIAEEECATKTLLFDTCKILWPFM